MNGLVQPDIQVEITLFQPEKGGRQTAIFEGEYRGVLGVGVEHFSVRFFVPTGDHIQAGRTVQIGVQFLFPERALPHFLPGTQFSVWEGRDIGRGHVLEVVGRA